MEKAEKVWMDGGLTKWEDAKLHVVSNTLHYGFGVFEGIRAYRTKEGAAIFRLADHLRRLRASAKILGFDLPFTLEQLITGVRDVVKANGLANCYVRPLAYIGYGGMGLSYEGCVINVSLAAWEQGEYVGEGVLERGSKVKTSSYARHHINTHMTKAKACGNYLLFQMARAEARRAGCDEALLLDTSGHVAEGAVEHVFLVRKGVLVTPPLTHLLDGITRDTVITLAREQEIEIRQELFSRDYLVTADEAFFAGTSAEVTPVVEVDGRTIGSGRPGPVTKLLQERYFECVHGRDKAHRDWVTIA